MIKYNPADAVLCLPEGDYMATIAEVEERVSQSGNDMHVITYTVYAGERQVRIVDYIPYPSMTWRLKRLAQALGNEDAFKSGKFDPSECIGSNVIVTLEVQKQDGYDDKNRIKAWSVYSTAPVAVAPAAADDDLPF